MGVAFRLMWMNWRWMDGVVSVVLVGIRIMGVSYARAVGAGVNLEQAVLRLVKAFDTVELRGFDEVAFGVV